MKRIGRLISVALAAVTVASVAATTPASATSNSGSAWFDNGKKITANAWIQGITWSNCGRFQTSAVMNASPKWIKNVTSFYRVGFGSISIKGANVNVSGGDRPTLTWTNNNGAQGSYISGTVCKSFGSLWVGVDVTASAFYYGNYRVASAHI